MMGSERNGGQNALKGSEVPRKKAFRIPQTSQIRRINQHWYGSDLIDM